LGTASARESKEETVPDEAAPGAEGQAPEGQPSAPEGQAEGTSGLYNEVLNGVPENLHSQVEPILKQWDSNVSKKFEEAAEYRKQWEPYEEMGVTQHEPERLQALLELGDVLDDPGLLQQWWKEVGDELGYFDANEEEGSEDELLTPEQVQQMVAEAVSPINEKLTSQEQEQLVAQASEDISTRLDQLAEKDDSLGKEIGKSDEGEPITGRDAVLQLALAYEDQENPIDKGYADYQRLIGHGEGSLFEKKVKQPGGAEGPGSPAGPKQFTSFDEANESAMRKLEESAKA
jgi:hypothetical protein